MSLQVCIGDVLQAREKASKVGLELESRVSFRVGDAQDEGLFALHSFDRILCSSAALYMTDPAKAAGTFRGWLKEKGRFVFNTPQVCSLPLSAVMFRIAFGRS